MIFTRNTSMALGLNNEVEVTVVLGRYTFVFFGGWLSLKIGSKMKIILNISGDCWEKS